MVAASTRRDASSKSGMPRTKSVMGSRESSATPLYVFCPLNTLWYPAAVNSGCGKSGSCILVSCNATTAGWTARNHSCSCSPRTRNEFTFQVAIWNWLISMREALLLQQRIDVGRAAAEFHEGIERFPAAALREDRVQK